MFKKGENQSSIELHEKPLTISFYAPSSSQHQRLAGNRHTLADD